MTLPEALEIFDYWHEFPPEHEMLAMLARIYTTWRPTQTKPLTEEEARAAHMRDLERRWASGAMNAKQIMEAFGGATAISVNAEGVAQQVPGGT